MSVAGALVDESQPHFEYSHACLDISNSVYRVWNRYYYRDRNEWLGSETIEFPIQRLTTHSYSSIGALDLSLRESVDAINHSAYIAAILSGLKSDVGCDFGDRVSFYAPALVPRGSPAHELLKLKAFLGFYGEAACLAVVRDYASILQTYDRQLVTWSRSSLEFAEQLRHLETDATAAIFADKSNKRESRMVGALRKYLCAGDFRGFSDFAKRLAQLEPHPQVEFGHRLEVALTNVDQDVCLYTIWRSCGGDLSFTFDEFRTLAARLAEKGSTALANELLLECARRFPGASANHLDVFARELASQAGDRSGYEQFRKLVSPG